MLPVMVTSVLLSCCSFSLDSNVIIRILILMKLVAISDLHGTRPQPPDADVLAIIGDFACGDDISSLRRDIAWLNGLTHKHIVSVLGNHDLIVHHLLKTRPDIVKDLFGRIHLLIDDSLTIDGVQIYGVGWGSQAPIPSTNIILSHAPIAGILDQRQPPTSEHLGNPHLARQVNDKPPRLFACGHIHGGYGRVERNGTIFINCSLVNESRQLVNRPWACVF